MADEKEGKSTLDLLKETYDFFAPKKKTEDSGKKMSKKEKKESDKDIGNVFGNPSSSSSSGKIPDVPEAPMSYEQAKAKIFGSIDTKNQTVNVSSGTMDGYGRYGLRYEEGIISRKGTEMARLRIVRLPEGQYTAYAKDAFGKESKSMTDMKEIQNYLRSKGVEIKEMEASGSNKASSQKQAN